MENDDITKQVEKLLSNPESMARFRQMAESLLSENTTDDALDGVDINKVLNAVKLIKNGGDDSRTRLLLALKPHLGSERAARVDKAVKLLKIASLLPLLNESDLLNL